MTSNCYLRFGTPRDQACFVSHTSFTPMFQQYFSYFRETSLRGLDHKQIVAEMKIDDVERFRNDPACLTELEMILKDLNEKNKTERVTAGPNNQNNIMMFFWLNVMEFIMNFTHFSPRDKFRLISLFSRVCRWHWLSFYVNRIILNVNIWSSDQTQADHGLARALNEYIADCFCYLRRDLTFEFKWNWNESFWMIRSEDACCNLSRSFKRFKLSE